jgi:uncharacterized protein YPO0396
LQTRVAGLKAERDRWNNEAQRLRERRAGLQDRLNNSGPAEQAAHKDVEEKELAVQRIENADTPEWADEARRRYRDTRRQHDAATVIKNYMSQREGDETKLRNAQDELNKLQLLYQKDFEFYIPSVPDDDDRVAPYLRELARLEATELPRYRNEIAQAKHEAEIEFRENFIHELRDRIRGAKRQLDNINEALKAVPFASTTYQFKSAPAPRYLKFYNLIVQQDSESLGLPLLEGGFLDEHQDVVDELFRMLTSQIPGVAAEEVEHLRDYRYYLTYDIDLHYSDGHKASFNQIGRSQSGGKTQTPFYVTVVAAFAQLYHVQEPHLSDTARIIVFDEAFSKMDGQHIASALALMRTYDLQVITATPPGKYDDLAPYMETCLSIVRSGFTASIEPFYNREAERLVWERVAK